MKDKRPTLFYSWQSDDSKTRGYIEKALKKALKNVSSDIDIQDAPRLDKDTQGEVGAVSITATIKRKISESKIFIADVSLIDEGRKGKKLANQNVMFELGYAFGKKTEKAVMLVANSDLGEASELPFDIAQNRIIFCSPVKDPTADKLVPVLEYAIRSHLDFVNESLRSKTQDDIKEQLINAIETGKPTQTKAEVFFENIFKRYIEIAPEPSEGGEVYVDYGERTIDAYQKTLPLTLELFDIINTAAEYHEIETIQICYKMLGNIAVRYEKHSADEYAALLLQEIASIIIGLLAHYGHWDDIYPLLDDKFTKPKGGIRKYKIENTYQYPEGVKQYYNKKTGQNYTIPTTPLLQERFINSDRVLQTYVSGSLILMLSLEFYYPYASGLLLGDDDAYIPEYIAQLKFKAFAIKFSHALGVNSIDELHKRLEQKRQQLLSDGFAYWNRDITHMFKAENLMPINENVGMK